MRVARAEARALGYHLGVDEVGDVTPLTHMAFAARANANGPTGASMARILAYGESRVEAVEKGLDVLRGIVERDDAWRQAG